MVVFVAVLVASVVDVTPTAVVVATPAVPVPVVALEVAVIALENWETELEAPAISVGPGIVYTKGLA